MLDLILLREDEGPAASNSPPPPPPPPPPCAEEDEDEVDMFGKEEMGKIWRQINYATKREIETRDDEVGGPNGEFEELYVDKLGD